MNQPILSPAVTDWQFDLSVYQHNRHEAESDTRETTRRHSVAGRVAVLAGHTVRAILRSFVDGIAQHGAAHHGFPDHHRHHHDDGQDDA